MNKKHILWIVAGLASGCLCLVAVVIGYMVYQVGTLSTQMNNSAGFVGNPAPDFRLVSMEEESVTLASLLDKPLFLCFGATWCPDCKVEAPLLQRLKEQHPEVRVVWVDSKEAPEKVSRFLETEGLTFQTLIDQDGKVAQQYMVWAVPTVYVIDSDGLIKTRFIEKLTQAQIDETLSNLGIEP